MTDYDKLISLLVNNDIERTNGNAVMVRLQVANEASGERRERWVGFNGVGDLALIKDRK